MYFTFEGSGWALFNMDWWQFSGNQVLQNTVIKGDVNGDSVIDIFDLGLAKQMVLKSQQNAAADVDENGKLEVRDLILLTKWLHHQITAFPTVEKPSEPPTEPTTQPVTEAAKPTAIANPLIWCDVPDMDYIRVGDTYYMVSTTMFFNPGVPIMKSKDLVSWELCSYVYDTFENNDTTNLLNGKNAYGTGNGLQVCAIRTADFICSSPATIRENPTSSRPMTLKAANGRSIP